MRVSAKAEYACVALLELAAKHRGGQPVQIKTIAESHRISPRFLVQILIQLKGAGLVTSSRGAAGGYVLARPPETITLANIIHTIDPPPDGLPRDAPTSTAMDCLRDVWRELNDAERRVLENTTLAELVLRTQVRDNSSYQI
jgi:Rrf2 family transcriptional regulator, cysteine metabolism repressor